MQEIIQCQRTSTLRTSKTLDPLAAMAQFKEVITLILQGRVPSIPYFQQTTIPTSSRTSWAIQRSTGRWDQWPTLDRTRPLRITRMGEVTRQR